MKFFQPDEDYESIITDLGEAKIYEFAQRYGNRNFNFTKIKNYLITKNAIPLLRKQEKVSFIALTLKTNDNFIYRIKRGLKKKFKHFLKLF